MKPLDFEATFAIARRLSNGDMRRGERNWIAAFRTRASPAKREQSSIHSEGGLFMRQEIRQEEEVNKGLTTADLANTDEPTSTKRDPNRDKGLDRATADLESRQNVFRSTDAPATERERTATTNAGSIAPDRRDEDQATPLFSTGEAEDFHLRWDTIQVSFVDEPRQAVQQADGLVASAMKRLAEIFAEE